MKPDAHLILIAVACGLSGRAEGYGGYGGGYGSGYDLNYLGYGGGYDYYNRRPPPYVYQHAAVSPAPAAAGDATPGASATTARRQAALATRRPAVAQSAGHSVQLTHSRRQRFCRRSRQWHLLSKLRTRGEITAPPVHQNARRRLGTCLAVDLFISPRALIAYFGTGLIPLGLQHMHPVGEGIGAGVLAVPALLGPIRPAVRLLQLFPECRNSGL